MSSRSPRPGRDGVVIQVTMLDALRVDMEFWLRDRGLALQQVPQSRKELDNDAGMLQYVVVIPQGSPLQTAMRST